MLTLPTLPQAEVDTTYDEPTGGTNHTPVNSAALATILANPNTILKLGDTITLTAGTTYVGPFTLPNVTTQGSGSNGWIYMKSSNHSSLPTAGTRVVPADATNMAIIQGGTLEDEFAMGCVDLTHHYRLIGMEIRTPTGTPSANIPAIYSLFSMGDGSQLEAELAHHIILDRCYIHGRDSQEGPRRCVRMDAANAAVIECYLDNAKQGTASGQDSQGIACFSSTGPLKIHNNYIEGASENILLGGGGPSETGMETSDVTVTRNTIEKRTAWISAGWIVKNAFEIKHARRVLVRGNLIQNSWDESDQRGFAVVLTVRNEGLGTQNVCNDVTLHYNKLLDVAAGFNMHGTDDLATSLGADRILIEQNLVVEPGGWAAGRGYDNGTGSGPFFQIIGDDNYLADLTFRHNSLIALDTPHSAANEFTRDATKKDRFYFVDNITNLGTFGWRHDDTGNHGTTALDEVNDTLYDFTNSLFVDPTNITLGSYPSGNFSVSANSNVGYVDLAGENYRLTPGGTYAAGGASDATDGTDLGANIDDIEDYIDGTLPAQGGSAIALDSGGRRGGRMIGLVPQGYR